ncbi:hypothetical protein SGPA1_11185 [Streptomyces misionensis JCM 4497]
MAGIWSASKARRTSSPAICPSAFPRSMSAMTETDSAISGGSVRDVLADTNNLSERWKTASGTVHCGREPTTGLGMGRRRGRGPGGFTAPCPASVFPPRLSPLRSSRCPHECYAHSAWPESHPVSEQNQSDMGKRERLTRRPGQGGRT